MSSKKIIVPHSQRAIEVDQLLEICPIPLTYKEIAEILHCNLQTISELVNKKYIEIHPLGKRIKEYVKNQIKSHKKRLYRLRAELGIGPVKMYDYVFEVAGKNAFNESTLDEQELEELFSTLRSPLEKKVAKMILKGKSQETVCKATDLSTEGFRKYVGGLGLYSTREELKRKLGKKKLYTHVRTTQN